MSVDGAYEEGYKHCREEMQLEIDDLKEQLLTEYNFGYAHGYENGLLGNERQ